MCDHDTILRDEYGVNSFEEIVSEEQQAAALPAITSEMTPLKLGNRTFYVRQIPERLVSALPLLEAGPETAEDAYRVSQLLRGLKRKTSVVAVDDRGRVFGEYSAARRLFLQALKEKEGLFAHNLRTRLRLGEEW